MTSKFDCFGPGFLPGFLLGFLKWVYPKKPTEFFGYVPGCPNRDLQRQHCHWLHRYVGFGRATAHNFWGLISEFFWGGFSPPTP